MNTMPGNPYAQQFNKIEASDEAEATLALAFEKRTENLIALAALCTANGRKELGEPFVAEAIERLGGDTK